MQASLVRGARGRPRRSAVARERLRARSLAALAALATAAVLLAGCSTSHPPPISAAELASAQTFPYYTLYWAGPSFAHHPVTAADGVEGYKPKTGDSIYYGDCASGNGVLGAGGCRLPLEVTTAVYALRSNVDLGPQRNVVIRGVPAAIFDEGRSIELYTGRLVIDLYSNDPARALAAAAQLRPLNAGGSSDAPLPPPVYCPILAGKRPISLYRLMQRLPGRPCQEAALSRAQREALKQGS